MVNPKPDPDPMEQASLPVFLVAQRQPDEVGRARCRVVHLSDAKRIRDQACQAAFEAGAAHAITHISEALGDEDDIAEMMNGEYAPADEVRP